MEGEACCLLAWLLLGLSSSSLILLCVCVIRTVWRWVLHAAASSAPSMRLPRCPNRACCSAIKQGSVGGRLAVVSVVTTLSCRWCSDRPLQPQQSVNSRARHSRAVHYRAQFLQESAASCQDVHSHRRVPQGACLSSSALLPFCCSIHARHDLCVVFLLTRPYDRCSSQSKRGRYSETLRKCME
jgi:hypothetical protein